MSCRDCQKKNDAYFIALGRATNNTYGKYKEKDSTKYIPLNAFIKAQEKGYISQETEIEVLQ